MFGFTIHTTNFTIYGDTKGYIAKAHGFNIHALSVYNRLCL